MGDDGLCRPVLDLSLRNEDQRGGRFQSTD